MNPDDRSLVEHAQRCALLMLNNPEISEPIIDQLRAHLVASADSVGITLADPRQARQLVAVTLVVDTVAVEAMRLRAATVAERTIEAGWATLLAGLLAPYVQ